jgi:hypothetical protein
MIWPLPIAMKLGPFTTSRFADGVGSPKIVLSDVAIEISLPACVHDTVVTT